MDEYIDLLQNDGSPSGQKCLKSEAHKKGLFHASVHIWFYTQSGQILIQKRKKDKDTFPDLWDISVAGHISFKESHINAAIRETEEEIGILVSTQELNYIGTSEHKNIHPNNITDHELHHIYICRLNTSTKTLSIQEEEVEEIKLIPLTTLKQEVFSKEHSMKYVPHGKTYYNLIFDAINNATNMQQEF
jgi:isopentenyldiphosphate isomerase